MFNGIVWQTRDYPSYPYYHLPYDALQRNIYQRREWKRGAKVPTPTVHRGPDATVPPAQPGSRHHKNAKYNLVKSGTEGTLEEGRTKHCTERTRKPPITRNRPRDPAPRIVASATVSSRVYKRSGYCSTEHILHHPHQTQSNQEHMVVGSS